MKRNIALLLTLVYLVFACLYVVVYHAPRSGTAGAAGFSVIKSADDQGVKNHAFLSRPRVVNTRVVQWAMIPVLLVCFFVFANSLLSYCRQPLAGNFPYALFYPSKIILLRVLKV